MARKVSMLAPDWWDYTTLDDEILNDAARLTEQDISRRPALRGAHARCVRVSEPATPTWLGAPEKSRRLPGAEAVGRAAANRWLVLDLPGSLYSLRSTLT